jgi:glutamate carboxypeptidase
VTGGIDPVRLREHLRGRRDEMLDELRALVEHESPSGDEGRLNKLAQTLAVRLESLGARSVLHRTAGTGTHIEARFDAAGGHQTPILILCHMDTVHPVGMLERNPFRIEQCRALGPGSQDMKGGIVIVMHAMQALMELGMRTQRPIAALFTCDEETGSHSSRPLIERLAVESEIVLVPEPAGPGGAVKTARKWFGHYELAIAGRAAHAGLDFESGISAILESAGVVLELHDLCDLLRGTTVNVGRMEGGTVANVVAEFARADVDVRFFDPDEGSRVDAAIRGLQGAYGARITVSGGINRPPLERTPEVVALFEHARSIARDLGFELDECAVGGASDGNLTSALGVPTLDGLGAVGSGLHTARERIDIAELPLRAALLAGLLLTL